MTDGEGGRTECAQARRGDDALTSPRELTLDVPTHVFPVFGWAGPCTAQPQAAGGAITLLHAPSAAPQPAPLTAPGAFAVGCGGAESWS